MPDGPVNQDQQQSWHTPIYLRIQIGRWYLANLVCSAQYIAQRSEGIHNLQTGDAHCRWATVKPQANDTQKRRVEVQGYEAGDLLSQLESRTIPRTNLEGPCSFVGGARGAPLLRPWDWLGPGEGRRRLKRVFVGRSGFPQNGTIRAVTCENYQRKNAYHVGSEAIALQERS